MKRLARGTSVLLAVGLLAVSSAADDSVGDRQGLKMVMEDSQKRSAIQADKAGFVRQLLARWAGEAAARGYDRYVEKGTTRLLRRSPGELLALSKVDAWATFDKVAFRGFSIDAFGALMSDLIFTPLAPCRLLDTRIGTVAFLGPFLPGTEVTFSVNDALGPQGGNPSGCGVSGVGGGSDPSALAITLTAASPSGGPGNLRVFAAGDPVPTAAHLTYNAGVTISTGAITESCLGCGAELTVRNQGAGSTHIVVDVVGVFTPPSGFGTSDGGIWAAAHVTTGGATAVTRSFSNLPGAPTVTAVRLAAGEYQVDFGADVTGRYYMATQGQAAFTTLAVHVLLEVTPDPVNPNALLVRMTNAAGASVDANFFVAVY